MRSSRANFSSLIAALRLALVIAAPLAVPLAPTTRAATDAAAVLPAPELSVALRGSIDGTVELGEPLFVAVRLDAASATEKSVEVAPAGKPWTEAVTVELSASDDPKPLARGRVVPGTASPDSVLDAEHALTGLWWFSAGDLRGLAAGSYVVRAHASAGSSQFEFQVVPVSQNRERVIQRTIALAAAAQIDGATNNAIALLDEFLAHDPDASPVLIARAEIALSAGDVEAAAVCAYRAKELENRGSTEPSIALHALIASVQAALANNTSPHPPVVAAQLPPSVRAPIRKQISESVLPAPAGTAPPAPGK